MNGDRSLSFEGNGQDYSGVEGLTPQEEDETSNLARKETENLRRFRFTFTMVMLLFAVGLAVGIFFLTRRQEEEALNSSFHDQASKVYFSFQDRISRKITAMQQLSFAYTSFAQYKNLTWPFVTMPDFDIRAASTRSLAQTETIVICPYVEEKDREAWQNYTKVNRDWIIEGSTQLEFSELYSGKPLEIDYITEFENGQRVVVDGPGPYYPAWQSSPVAKDLVNLDWREPEFDELMATGDAVLGESGDIDIAKYFVENDLSVTDYSGPIQYIHFPIYDVLDPAERQAVGTLTTSVYWESFMVGILPTSQGGLWAVLWNDCGQYFTYTIYGTSVDYIGVGDLHDKKADKYSDTKILFDPKVLYESTKTYRGANVKDLCNFQLTLYPTQDMEDEYLTTKPWLFFGLVIAIFFFLAIVIYVYDWKVEKNYQEIYKKAQQAGAIVSSIFPAAVRKRLYNEDNSTNRERGTGGFKQTAPAGLDSNKAKLKGFLNDPASMPIGAGVGKMDGIAEQARIEEKIEIPDKMDEKPIADLFPDVTILFADIVGFTPWSSQREPGEVFTLLQSLYHEFDMTARILNVFKVETIGDCYVAATGIPEPQEDHAPRMARFATKIMASMIEVTRQLEVRLGPDTGELRIRVGLHSGPVTAGVLRGTKSRFQLFGDTMNMAARMEHNSKANRIQCSEATAALLKEAGKEHWIRPREDKVKAKGKGEVQTYWIVPKTGGPSMAASDKDDEDLASYNDPDEEFNTQWGNTKLVFDLGTPGNRYQRLIDWNVELLAGLLKQIEANRRDKRVKQRDTVPTMELQGGSTALDEITEVIKLPQFDTKNVAKRKTRPEDVELTIDVITQLRDYVTTIASMYRDNPFHNFEHASHVTMSTNKLLKRVVVRDAQDEDEVNAMDLHDYTYGITSDPLTQFSLVFCALVHDVDHAGVSNFQLIQENATIAKLYKNKSVAEQNSVDLAWDLLMDPNYKDLQKAIYSNEDELRRFRQLMVNIVLATDIFDKDMKTIREKRWGRAFQYENEEEEEISPDKLPIKAIDRDQNPLHEIEGANLKATIVMEHLIQASDVAHTMQHWEIYLKWNERLFNEMYTAYENGRALKDPSQGWYEGEIMFFDKYVIPLAKKLDDCGVFGVSSDECLNYATQNRKQWAIQGDKIVDDMLRRFHEKKEEVTKAKKAAARKASMSSAATSGT